MAIRVAVLSFPGFSVSLLWGVAFMVSIITIITARALVEGIIIITAEVLAADTIMAGASVVGITDFML